MANKQSRKRPGSDGYRSFGAHIGSVATGGIAALAAVAALSILGAGHILLRTSTFGAALTADSIGYLQQVLSAMAGSAPVSALAPPLFPYLLAGAGLFSGIEPVELARWINAAAFGATILCSGLWLARVLRSRALAIGATAAIAASIPVADVASFVWTEPVFILLVALALTALDSATNPKNGSGSRRLYFTVACVSIMLAAITRYPGVTLILTGVLVLLFEPRAKFSRRLRAAFIFGVASSVPLAALLAYHWVTLGTPVGDRPFATREGVQATLSSIEFYLREWILGPFTGIPWLAACAAITGFGVAAGIIRLASQRTVCARPAAARFEEKNTPSANRGSIRSFYVFMIVYIVFLAITAPLFTHQKVDSRYLSPIYAPGIMALAFLLDSLADSGRTRLATATRFAAAYLLLGSGLAHTVLSAWAGLERTRTAIREGYGGYNVSDWLDGDIVSYFRTEAPHTSIADNNGAILPTLIYRTHTLEGRKYANRTTRLPFGKLTAFMQWLAGRPDGSHIVWFHSIGYFDNMFLDYDIVDLRCAYGLKEVMNTVQGAIFKVDKRHDPKCDSIGGQLMPGRLLSHSTYSVYIEAGTIYYWKYPCTTEDTAAPFFLHIVPALTDDLPAWRKESGFDNLDWLVGSSLTFRDGACRAAVTLPEYAHESIRTGQWEPGKGGLWSVEYTPDPETPTVQP